MIFVNILKVLIYYNHVKDGKICKSKLSKTTRYFASKKGGTLFKKNLSSNSLTGVLIGQNVHCLINMIS